MQIYHHKLEISYLLNNIEFLCVNMDGTYVLSKCEYPVSNAAPRLWNALPSYIN